MLSQGSPTLTLGTPGRASPLRLCPLGASWPLPGGGAEQSGPAHYPGPPPAPRPAPRTPPAAPLMFGPASSGSR